VLLKGTGRAILAKVCTYAKSISSILHSQGTTKENIAVYLFTTEPLHVIDK
jgi:hypothetical protein